MSSEINKGIEPVCVNSKGKDGGQPSLEDRIYLPEVATAITTCFLPWYIVEEDNEKWITERQ